MFPVHSLNDYN